jgi:hypothetical protein
LAKVKFLYVEEGGALFNTGQCLTSNIFPEKKLLREAEHSTHVGFGTKFCSFFFTRYFQYFPRITITKISFKARIRTPNLYAMQI